MATTSDTSLQELKELISKQSEQINDRFEKLTTQINQIQIGQVKVEEQVKALEKEIQGVKDELKIQNGRFWLLVTILGTTLIGGFGTAIGIIIKIVFSSKSLTL